MKNTIAILFAFLVLYQGTAHAQPDPVMVQRGREVYANTFDEPVDQILERNGNNWQLFTTRWSVEDGVLRGRPATKEVQAANEQKRMKKDLLGGVPRVFMHKTLPQDLVCSFRIRFIGGETTRIDPHIEWGHHLMRVRVKDDSIQLLTDQEKVVMEEWKPGIVRGQWYDVLLERKGDRFFWRFGTNELSGRLDPDLRNGKHFRNFREGRPDMLGISGTKDGTVEIDDLYIWEAGAFLDDGPKEHAGLEEATDTGYRSAVAQPVEKVMMPLAELVKLDAEDVPERVHVTDMKVNEYTGKPAFDSEVYILETIPGNWVYTGRGRLTVSDQHSNAGKKSVRWDWKRGDVIRIKELGMLTKCDLWSVFAQRSGSPEAFTPSFSLAAYVENNPQENTAFHFYFQRMHKASRHAEPAPVTVQLRQFTNAKNTWFSMTGTAYEVTKVDGKDKHGFDNQKFVEAMPDGVAAPAENELIIQAPTNLESGTIYLDRLVVAASLTPEGTAKDKSSTLSSPRSGQGIVKGRVPYPERFTRLIPKKLNPQRQAYIDGLRREYFQYTDRTLKPDSRWYDRPVTEAKKYLERLCDKLPDGTYKFKAEVNNAGARVYFKGDLYSFRKFTHFIPESLNPQDIHYGTLARKAGELLLQRPDSPEVVGFFKAYMDWEMQQVYNPPNIQPPGGKYGYQSAQAKDVCAFMIGKPEFKKYYDYISLLPISGDAAHYGIYDLKETPYWSLEFPHSGSVFDNMLFEPNDEKLYAMLENYRNSLSMYYAISTPGRAGMIKPDYGFFHHGELSYWGNIEGHYRGAAKYADGPLALSPDVHKTMANHISRYTFGLATAQGLKGGQSRVWTNVHKLKELPRYAIERTAAPFLKPDDERGIQDAVRNVTSAPKDHMFHYLYDLDWQKVPAAKKYAGAVLARATYSPLVEAELKKQFPKLSDVSPQDTINFSSNYTGFAVHTRGPVRASAFTNADFNTFRAGAGTRMYGMLALTPGNSSVPYGATHNGYSWFEIPGTTMPSLTEKDHDGVNLGYQDADGNIAQLDIRLLPGSGTLTFNETEDRFGEAGNYSLLVNEIRETEEKKKKTQWTGLGVENFEGRKSYHFFSDKVVCLGSNYRADTTRKMKTVLIQELTDEIPWSHRDYDRWNPEKPTLNVNGRMYEDTMQLGLDLSGTNYFVSPYGQAWIIPGSQKGHLKFDWRERETQFFSRFDPDTGNIKFNGRMTNGTGVIASLQQDAAEPSSHHYCVLMNSDGKSPEELAAHAKNVSTDLGYEILQQDAAAHGVAFGGPDDRDLHSYVIYEPETELKLPLVSSVNRRLNLMMQRNADGNFVASIADPEINYDEARGIKHEDIPGYNKLDPRNIRTVKVVFTKPIELLEARSGLSESNPDLDAGIEARNTLAFQTRDGVSDTFIIKLVD